MTIPDHDLQGISDAILVDKIGNLKRVVVDLDIEHTYIGDLRVDLVSPTGTNVRLHNNDGGSIQNIKRSYDVSSTPDLNVLIDEPIKGDWKLHIRDLASLDEGTLVSWSIDLDY